MDELGGKVAVVTGGASGIGYALAERFVAEGMRVVIADVEEPALAEAVERLGDVVGVRCDVSRREDIEALCAAALDAYGRVNVVCNNAGVVVRGNAWEQTLDDWQWIIDVDLWGVVHGVRTFVPHMLAHGEPGHIVNTASIAGLLAFPRIASYNVAKAGVVSLSESLLVDLREEGAPIGVSVLCPGVVTTRITESERNRPGVDASSMASSDSQQSPEALSAADVADQVLDAIGADRFWVLPHEHYADKVAERADGVLTDAAPPVPVYR